MELPADAVFINQTRGSPYKLYRFADGLLHDLTRQSVMLKASFGFQKVASRGLGLHLRWHVNRGKKKEGCNFCFSEETNGAPKYTETREGDQETGEAGTEDATPS